MNSVQKGRARKLHGLCKIAAGLCANCTDNAFKTIAASVI